MERKAMVAVQESWPVSGASLPVGEPVTLVIEDERFFGWVASEAQAEAETSCMKTRSKTVRVLFPDGQERTFTKVVVDQKTAGWLFLIRIQDSPIISGVLGPVAGYRLKKLKGWEYVDTDPS